MLSTEVKRMFAEVDVDGSGAIDASELRELLQKMGVYLTARELELAVLSIDKDGSVSFDSQMPLFCSCVM
jgi:Ca2+-binding EF-hand superfamily protein